MATISVQKAQAMVLWLEQIRLTDVPIVGGKSASLGELIQQLVPQGINVPSGFAVTASAYRHFIRSNALDETLRTLFADLDVTNVKNLQKRGRQARSLILQAPFPADLEVAIRLPAFIGVLPESLVQSSGDHLLRQIVRQVSRRLTWKVQEDFHAQAGLACPPRRRARF